MRLVLWGLALIAIVALLDRVVLRFEARGWINYRRRGLGKGGASYHLLQLQSIFDPGAKEVIEVKYQRQREEDASGDTR